MSPVTSSAEPTAQASFALDASATGPVIAPEIYGQFAEHLGTGVYGGVWVGPESSIPNTRGMRNDVLEALRELKVPVVRWPGGCFADEYHWKDGIGPREERPSMINTNWGGVVEDNSFGTHEFLDFCELVGAEPFISGNIGSGTVREMSEWVEYMTSGAETPMTRLRQANGRDEPWKIKFFGLGNETWGCGGNMTVEYYADVYRRFNTFVKDYPGNKLVRVACGPSDRNYEWTRVMMDKVGDKMNALSLHYYTLPTGNWGQKGSAVDFPAQEWFDTFRRTLDIDEFITHHCAIMDQKDPDRKIALYVDEWGTWYDPQPGTNPGFLRQQNTLRDALVAGLNLHIFQAHAERVRMANIAQMVNVLQAMIFTDGADMVLTPTYHAFEMMNVHQGSTSIPLHVSSARYTLGEESLPAVSASATKAEDGRLHVSLVNIDPQREATVRFTLVDFAAASISGRVLTAAEMDGENTFDAPSVVTPAPFKDFTQESGTVTVTLPSKSLVVLELVPAK